jgi:TATA-box binding protein (TBP) (component of TFIID and TFIIIB)
MLVSGNNVDIAWKNFINNSHIKNTNNCSIKKAPIKIPKCGDIYISTKTMICYLNQSIDLTGIFWKIPILNYYTQTEGVVKKQIKINCTTVEEVGTLETIIKEETRKNKILDVHILKQIKSKKGLIKDNRKISIGLSRKDLITRKKKKKGAFYNCFVLILRILCDNKFKEIHIKIFNTGKLEIPGIQNNKHLIQSLNFLVEILQPFIDKKLSYDTKNIETVLINSNFNCGFYINRDKLYNILKYNYRLQIMFDPCSYPGIQCKFYFNNNNEKNEGICYCSKKCNRKGKGKGNGECREISFMIFRTGSILIVGHCEESTIEHIYNFLKKLLHKEFPNIFVKNNDGKKKIKHKKIKKKIILYRK